MAVWSIIKRSKLQRATRIDPEYYQPEYLALDKEFLSDKLKLTDIRGISSFVKKGIFDISPDKYIDQGIPLIRVQNIRSGFLSYNNMVFISELEHLKNKKTELTEGDLVLSKVGTIGEVAIISGKDRKCNFSQNTIGVKINKKKIKSEYLLLYFLSNLGQLQLQRSQMFQVQSKLELEDIRDLKVVLLNDSVQEEFSKIVAEIIKLRESSEEIYSQAEHMLLEELGLKDLELKNDLFYTTKLKDVKDNNRIDSYFFDPKFNKALIKFAEKYELKGVSDLSKDVTTGQYSDEYLDDKSGAPYIRGTDISSATINEDGLLYIDTSKQIPSKKAKEGDVVTTRVGTIGLTAMIPKELEGATISDNLVRIRLPKKCEISSYYLTMYLNSPFGKDLMFRYSRGSVQQRLNQETLKEIPIPIIPESQQLKIERLLIESWGKRKQAKILLDQAKRKVEEMIEKEAGVN